LKSKALASEEAATYTPLTQDAATEQPTLSGDLGRIVAAWDRLPLHIRSAILALVDAAGGK
jgi:hypothetical protein